MGDNRQNTVQLGCGTLILIALIVMIFSNRGDHSASVKNEIKDLRQEISTLNDKVDNLTKAILTLTSQESAQPVATDAQTGDRQTTATESDTPEELGRVDANKDNVSTAPAGGTVVGNG